jgi:hypothetical protein
LDAGWPWWENQREVRRAWLYFGVLLAGVGSVASVGLASGGAISSQPLTGRIPGSPARAHTRVLSYAGDTYQIVIEPSLGAGGAGWESFINYTRHGRIVSGSGGGGGYPTPGWPFFAGTESFATYAPGQAPKGDVVDYVLVGPEVAAVRIGKEIVQTFASAQLPNGDRAAVFFRRAAAPPVVVLPLGPRGPAKVVRLVALDSAGHVIPTRIPSPPAFETTRFWQAPGAVGPNNHQPPYHGPNHPLPGACELSQHGLPGLTPAFGHVIRRIVPASSAEGEVFLSCIDTEYYLHGWPLEVGVLLDAVQPGKTLGGIPGALPVPGHPNTVNLAIGQFPGALTAERVGEAWLAVQGGASLKQRLRVLGALRIRKLALPS